MATANPALKSGDRRAARVLALDGVQEDVINILLNLKGVVLKLHNRDHVLLKLAKNGEGAMTSGGHQAEPRHPRDRRSRPR